MADLKVYLIKWPVDVYKSDIAHLFQTPHFEGSTWAFAATVLVFLVAIIWEAGEHPQHPPPSS